MDKKKVMEAQQLASQARSLLEEVRDDEQEKFDEKSDSWKEGDNGQAAEAKIGSLTDAVDTLESVDSSIEEALGG